jgi:hypothetical protein
VQWLCGGVYQFPKPRKIQKIDFHEETNEFYYFFEGSDCGIPESQLVLCTDIEVEPLCKAAHKGGCDTYTMKLDSRTKELERWCLRFNGWCNDVFMSKNTVNPSPDNDIKSPIG